MISPWVAILFVVVGVVWMYLCCHAAYKYRKAWSLHPWYDLFRPMLWAVVPLALGVAMLIWG